MEGGCTLIRSPAASVNRTKKLFPWTAGKGAAATGTSVLLEVEFRRRSREIHIGRWWEGIPLPVIGVKKVHHWIIPILSQLFQLHKQISKEEVPPYSFYSKRDFSGCQLAVVPVVIPTRKDLEYDTSTAKWDELANIALTLQMIPMNLFASRPILHTEDIFYHRPLLLFAYQ